MTSEELTEANPVYEVLRDDMDNVCVLFDYIKKVTEARKRV